jgi:hypothetical protein
LCWIAVVNGGWIETGTGEHPLKVVMGLQGENA